MTSPNHASNTDYESDNDHVATAMHDLDDHGSMASSQNITRTANVGNYSGHCNSYYDSVRKFWQRQISVKVDHEACRDHFGTLLFFRMGQCLGLRAS